MISHSKSKPPLLKSGYDQKRNQKVDWIADNDWETFTHKKSDDNFFQNILYQIFWEMAFCGKMSKLFTEIISVNISKFEIVSI